MIALGYVCYIFWQDIEKVSSNIFDTIENDVMTAINDVKSIVSTIDTVVDGIESVVSTIDDGVSDVGNGVSSIWDDITDDTPRRRAVGIFKNRQDFQKFLDRDDFIPKLSALSYLEPVENNQENYVLRLYFRKHNRVSTLGFVFPFAQFQVDDQPKRNYFDKKNELSQFIRDFEKMNIESP
jgi:hypothetical protein